ncbi:MAG: SAP domain-containing protein [Candidatus Omnitrophica bacterium]|jgi:hypothetical protein|nr:SAP domain-containing protein [Candidatus Omnitrophota bacterium]
MRLTEVEKKAKQLGLKDTWKHSKKDLIKQIQAKEGFSSCFGTANHSCAQMSCCWREDCIK